MYVIGSKIYLASAGIRTRDPWGTVEVTAATSNSRLRMRSRFYQSGDDDFHRGPSTHQPAQSLKIS